jgi:hypothetical protein
VLAVYAHAMATPRPTESASAKRPRIMQGIRVDTWAS